MTNALIREKQSRLKLQNNPYNFDFSAVANFTQRHILSISLNDVHTVKDFYDIFNCQYINGKKIEFDKRLYVLEDLDCFKREIEFFRNSDQLITHKVDKHSHSSSRYMSSNGNTRRLSENTRFQTNLKHQGLGIGNETSSAITFTKFIEMLNSVMEREDVMMVLNTRSPEWIDTMLSNTSEIHVNL